MLTRIKSLKRLSSSQICKLNNKLAIGTAQFGMPYGIANKGGQVQQDEISAILNLAWEKGIDTLDTAKAYCASERSIGNYLNKCPGNSWIIITKISDCEKSVAEQVKDSSEKLTIKPSAVLAHSAELFIDDKFQNELIEVRENQMITKAGVSLYSEEEINLVLESTYKPDIIQLPLNILDTRLYRRNILTELYNRDIVIHARSVFLQGLFYLSQDQLKIRFNDVVLSIKRLKSIAVKNGLTLSELSLLWLVSLKEISKVVIGVDNLDQLKTHLITLKKKVDPSVVDEALSIHYENETILNPSLWS